MANLTQNISNTVSILGSPTLWGVFVWGVDRWGDSDKTPIRFEKVLSNSQVIDQALSAAGVFIRTFTIGVLSADFETSPRLRNGNWDYVIDFNPQIYTDVSSTDATFTCLPIAGTSWSEV